jgi:hypothetical protein
MGRPGLGTACAAALLLAGCANIPLGPSVMVLPAQGKPFDQFRGDDQTCRQWAAQQTGSASTAANQTMASGAVIGTAIGAGLGAAIGEAAGQPATGAAIGAGSGLLFGTATGASAGAMTGDAIQRRYDNSYLQCMYAYGNQVPSAAPSRRMARPPLPPPPPVAPAPARNLPPPPPLGPPPPPPIT